MKKRAHYIDAVKGVAILCITFLHFEHGVIPMWLNVWIGLFMITTFYFTSGWISGLQGKQVGTMFFFKKRIRQLGVPYLWFSGLIILFDIIWTLMGFMDNYILLRDIYKTATLRGIGTLWFLPVLLIGETLFYYIKNSKRAWIYALAGLILTIITSHFYYNAWLPLREASTLNKLIDAPIQQIVRGLQAWPIVAAGYLIAKYLWPHIIEYKKIVIALIGIITISFSVSQVVAPILNIYYINGVLSNILPAIGFICLFYVIGYKNLFSRFFIYWGINSLVLMCTHYSIVEEILKTIDNIFIHSGFTGPTTIVYFIFTILISYPIVLLFNHKLQFMLGKK